MYEDFKKHNKKEGIFSKIFYSLLLKTLVMILMFVAAMIYVKDNDNNKKKFKKIVYQNTISFARIYSTYKDYIGDIIPFKSNIDNNTKMVSSDKISYQSIKKDGNGYLLTVSKSYTVGSITSGIVVEIKKDEKYGKLIKVQDKNGTDVSYGYINNVNVKLYDYLGKGEIIGSCNGKLYLEFNRDNKFLSYEEYL